MQNACKNCQYATKADEKGEHYICRRNPPTPILVPQQNPMTGETGMIVQGYFPPVGADNWCGEHVPVMTDPFGSDAH